MSVCVLVSTSKDNVDKVTLNLTLAVTASEAGEPVSVILLSEGVRLAVKGYADSLSGGEPFKSMKQLLSQLFASGGQLYVSVDCLQKRQLKADYLLPNARRIGWPDVMQLIREADRTVQL